MLYLKNQLKLSLGLLIVLLLGACGGRSAETTYYVLDSGESTPVEAFDSAKDDDDYIKLQLRLVDMPSYLDRNYIVTREANGVQINIASFHSWAEGLESGSKRVMAEVLTPLFLERKIILQPLDDDSLEPWQIFVQVQRFDGPLNQSVILDARWTVRNSYEETLVSGAFVDSATAGPTYASMAKAQSNLLKKLAQSMVDPISAAIKED